MNRDYTEMMPGALGSAAGFSRNTNLGDRPPRPMDRIAAAADRVEQLTARLEEVASRFNGGVPNGMADGATRPMITGYLGSIDRLHGGLDSLEKLISGLSELA